MAAANKDCWCTRHKRMMRPHKKEKEFNILIKDTTEGKMCVRIYKVVSVHDDGAKIHEIVL